MNAISLHSHQIPVPVPRTCRDQSTTVALGDRHDERNGSNSSLDDYWVRQPSNRKWGTLTVAASKLAERRAAAATQAAMSRMASAATVGVARAPLPPVPVPRNGACGSGRSATADEACLWLASLPVHKQVPIGSRCSLSCPQSPVGQSAQYTNAWPYIDLTRPQPSTGYSARPPVDRRELSRMSSTWCLAPAYTGDPVSLRRNDCLGSYRRTLPPPHLEANFVIGVSQSSEYSSSYLQPQQQTWQSNAQQSRPHDDQGMLKVKTLSVTARNCSLDQNKPLCSRARVDQYLSQQAENERAMELRASHGLELHQQTDDIQDEDEDELVTFKPYCNLPIKYTINLKPLRQQSIRRRRHSSSARNYNGVASTHRQPPPVPPHRNHNLIDNDVSEIRQPKQLVTPRGMALEQSIHMNSKPAESDYCSVPPIEDELPASIDIQSNHHKISPFRPLDLSVRTISTTQATLTSHHSNSQPLTEDKINQKPQSIAEKLTCDDTNQQVKQPQLRPQQLNVDASASSPESSSTTSNGHMASVDLNSIDRQSVDENYEFDIRSSRHRTRYYKQHVVTRNNSNKRLHSHPLAGSHRKDHFNQHAFAPIFGVNQRLV